MSAPFSPRSTIIHEIQRHLPCDEIVFSSRGNSSKTPNVDGKTDIQEIFDRAVTFLQHAHNTQQSLRRLIITITVQQAGKPVMEKSYDPKPIDTIPFYDSPPLTPKENPLNDL